MKIKIETGEHGSYFVYINDELMKSTNAKDVRKIVNALLKMFNNKVEIHYK